MSSNIKVCTLNIGSGDRDWYNAQRFGLMLSATDRGRASDNYLFAEKQTANKLVELDQDIYCLQEVRNEDRPQITELKKRGYTIHHADDNHFDAVIAVKTSRFASKVENFSYRLKFEDSFSGGQLWKDVAVVRVRDLLTQKSIVIASAHIPGYGFAQHQETKEQAYIKFGDEFCDLLVNQYLPDADIQLIGADMNADPQTEIGNKPHGVKRFAFFQNNGFIRCQNESPTNINCDDMGTLWALREIDFIFARKCSLNSLIGRIIALFSSVVVKEKATSIKKDLFPRPMNQIGNTPWNYMAHSSDHLPVLAEFSYQIEPSPAAKRWHALKLWLFSWLPSTLRPSANSSS